MPRRQRAIPLTSSESNKPVAPADLWERLDAIVAASCVVVRPPNTFTVAEFGEKYNLLRDASLKRLQKLQQMGKVQKVGRIGNQTYYEIVEGK